MSYKLKRVHLWICFVIGSIIYQGGKIALGFPSTWGDTVAASYWVGAAFIGEHYLAI